MNTTAANRRETRHGAHAPAIVAVLMPEAIRHTILSPQAERQLSSIAQVATSSVPQLAAEELATLLDGATACITGWGTPPLSEDVIIDHPTLRLVAHTAGSIRRLLPPKAIEQGLRVSHAAPIIADAVAEQVIGQALLLLRHLHEIDRGMKTGGAWSELRERFHGRLLGALTVGVVGAGYVGRTVIRLFKAFGCRVLVYDPLLTQDQATSLGIEISGLDELCAAADIVTLHAPALPETRGMIGPVQLERLRDGAIFINTARAALVDEAALLEELRSGRIAAALDVFDQEPLPIESPFRSLSNVILSPHSAARTVDTYLRQGQAMVDEVQRFLGGEPLRYEITPEMLPTIA